MADQPRQPPEFKVRPGDALWLTSLPRATESAKHDWRAIHCLVNQRRDGIAPIVLETIKGECLRPPVKYECAFELCLRHLHGRHTPLDVACTVGALLADRAAHALKLPGRWVPTPDGVVDYATHSLCPEEALVATTADSEDSSTESDASESPVVDVCNPGTAPTSEKLATHESEDDSICSSVVPKEDEPVCTEECEEDANMRAEDIPTDKCSEDGIAIQLSHIEELSHTEETSPATANTSEVPDQRPASHRRKRLGRKWHQTWWNEDAWRHGNEQWYPRGSQWQRTTAKTTKCR